MFQNLPQRTHTPSSPQTPTTHDENSPTSIQITPQLSINKNISPNSVINKNNNAIYESFGHSNTSVNKLFNSRAIPKVNNTKNQVKDFKLQVSEMLKNDINRIDYNALSSTTSNVITNQGISISPLESISVSLKENSLPETIVNTSYQEDEEIEITNEDINLPSTKTTIPINELSGKTSELYDFQDQEYIDEGDLDPRVSFLNPHEAYVKVAPLRLGKPLAKNGTPLDLSSVPKRNMAGPLYNDDDHDIITKDELKLYSLLEYELNKENGSLNGNQQFDLEIDNNDDDSYTDKSFIYRLFHKKHSKEQKYMINNPWYRILHKIDHPVPEDEEIINNSSTSQNQFERNNTDMFPINYRAPPLSSNSFKRPISYVSSSKY